MQKTHQENCLNHIKLLHVTSHWRAQIFGCAICYKLLQGCLLGANDAISNLKVNEKGDLKGLR